jgi:NAD(P)-dependent dehydrogenase (short-subunit alcohol dehydrogenase family)
MKVFITGSTRGFGLIIAKAFKQQGNEIILNGRGCPNFNVKDEFCQQNVSTITAEKFKEYLPDVIVNNAFDKSSCISSLAGQINVLKEAIKYFDPKGGIIINIGSSKSIIPDVDDPYYAAAKYGLRGYSESVKFDAYKKGINIIDLYPGAINVGMAAYRDDIDDLMDAQELADFMVTLCLTKTFVTSTIHFNRKVRG